MINASLKVFFWPTFWLLLINNRSALVWQAGRYETRTKMLLWGNFFDWVTQSKPRNIPQSKSLKLLFRKLVLHNWWDATTVQHILMLRKYNSQLSSVFCINIEWEMILVLGWVFEDLKALCLLYCLRMRWEMCPQARLVGRGHLPSPQQTLSWQGRSKANLSVTGTCLQICCACARCCVWNNMYLGCVR